MKHWGRIKNNLDSKGRISLPARFRQEGVEYYVINDGLDGCLFLYTPQQYEQSLEKIKERASSKKSVRHYMRRWTKYATDVRLDGQGRILVPAELLELRNFKKEVIFQGTNDRIELWDPEVQEKYDREVNEKYPVTDDDLADLLD
ncbi:MAG: division/cell wall cluster transcriptional repressor MraZ [Gemmatimonadota bacterium]|nr:division/cell wall cluster transcriptional repressor MraZ [Gemmatimonadota bacterium]